MCLAGSVSGGLLLLGVLEAFAVVCLCLRCWGAQMHCRFLNLSQVYFCLSQQGKWISGEGTCWVMKHSYALEKQNGKETELLKKGGGGELD